MNEEKLRSEPNHYEEARNAHESLVKPGKNLFPMVIFYITHVVYVINFEYCKLRCLVSKCGLKIYPLVRFLTGFQAKKYEDGCMKERP